MNLATLILVFWIFIGVYFLIPSFIKEQKRKRREETQKKLHDSLMKKVREIGPLMRYNEVSGVVAVCSERDFSQNLDEYLKGVKSGKNDPFERITLKVNPTFTFWKHSRKECHAPIHVSNSEVLRMWVEDLVEDLTGIKKEDVGSREFDDACRQIFVEDGRLYVPFAWGTYVTKEKEKDKEDYASNLNLSFTDFEKYIKTQIKPS